MDAAMERAWIAPLCDARGRGQKSPGLRVSYLLMRLSVQTYGMLSWQMLALAYWIAVAAIGLSYGIAALRQSLAFTRTLRSRMPADLPKGVTPAGLIAAGRLEALRDAFLVASLGLNLGVGLLAAAPRGPGSAVISLLAILGVATLLAAYAILNYWLRAHR